MDRYRTIRSDSEGIFKDRGSKFIGYASPVYSREAFNEWLQSIKKEHFKARHHSPAYRIGLDQIEERSSDDGEPNGSAGLPILNQLKSHELINVGVVVVRYFGGTKLGVSGLIQAYKEATIEALRNATIIEKEIRSYYQLEFDYSIMTEVMALIKSDFLICSKKELQEKGLVEIGFSPSEEELGLLKMTSIIQNLPIEAVEEPRFDDMHYSLKKIGLR